MRLPRVIASGAGVRETGLVRAQDIGALTNVGAAEFQAIEKAGRAIGAVSDLGVQAYLNRQAVDDIHESGVATQRIQESWNKADDAVRNFNPAHDMPLPDDPKYLETLTTFGTRERDEFLLSSLGDVEKDTAKIFSGIRNPKTKARLIKQYNDFYADRTKALKGKLDKVLNDYQIDGMGKLARDAALNGNMETSDFYIDKMAEHGLITNVKATSLKLALIELSVKSQATELYSIGLYNEARDLVAGSALEVQDKESLLNTINLMEDRDDRKTKDLSYKRDMEVNDDFIEKIITKDLIPDEIEGSRLPEETSVGIFALGKLSQTEWKIYAKASFAEPPTETTREGFKSASDAVLQYALFDIGKETAYRRLLDARYLRGEMTDIDFAWAINHITTRYQPEVASDMKIAIDTAQKKAVKGWPWGKWESEKKKGDRAVRDLIAWVDSEIEAGRQPDIDGMNRRTAVSLTGETPGEDEKGNPLSDLSVDELLEEIMK